MFVSDINQEYFEPCQTTFSPLNYCLGCFDSLLLTKREREIILERLSRFISLHIPFQDLNFFYVVPEFYFSLQTRLFHTLQMPSRSG